MTESAIVPRATVRDMVKRRQVALDAFAIAHTKLAEAGAALHDARMAHAAIDHRGREDRYTSASKNEEAHFLHGLKVPTHADFVETARKMVDRRMWATLVEMTELERLMDKKAKDELSRQLQENVPEATEENIFATLQQFYLDSDTIFKRGIANCFSTLDRRFRSHDGWKIGHRVVLSHTFDRWGMWSHSSNQRDALQDIDRTFAVLDGREAPHLIAGIVAAVESGRRGGGLTPRQSVHETDYFRVRCFQNGNMHIWFKRDDLVEKVNKLLGEYYGAPIPEEREADTSGLHDAKTTLAKNYGFFPTPAEAARRAIEAMPIAAKGQALTVLEPSAGTGNLSRPLACDGNVVDVVEYQPGLAAALNESGLYRKVICGDFLMSHPEPHYDRVVMNPPFDRERDIDHVLHALKFLKPDGCLVAIMSAGTEFRETKKSVAFRAMIESMGGVYRDLPAGSFAESGTYVNTLMLRVWKDGRRQAYGF